jgi:acetyl/propionyl-CoA carboxylase alpha subunit
MPLKFEYQVGNEIKTVTVERVGDHFRVSVGEREYSVTARQQESGHLNFEVEGRQHYAYLAADGSQRFVAIAGETWVLEKLRPQSSRSQISGATPDSGSLEAMMPGLVREVLAVAGAEVARGDTLVVLEAMKMELRLTAPHAGRVRQVHCAAGQVVERGQVLVEIENSEAST